MMRSLLAVGVVCFPLAATAQRAGNARESDLPRRLAQLQADAALLQTALPRFECTESGVARRVRKGKDRDRTEFTGVVRVQPADGVDSGETLAVQSLRGKPVRDPDMLIPNYVRGGFDSVLLPFGPGARACYLFALSPAAPDGTARLDYTAVPAAGSQPQCQHAAGVHGFVLLDAAGNPTHVERTVPQQTSDRFHIVPFAAVDLAETELNGRFYPLSRHLLTSSQRDDSTFLFEATYTGCHQYASTIKVLPGGTSVVGPGEPAEPR